MVVRSQARKTKGTWNDGNGTYSINHYDLLDAVAIYFSRFERYSVHHILLSNHVLIWHVVFLSYWNYRRKYILMGRNYYGRFKMVFKSHLDNDWCYFICFYMVGNAMGSQLLENAFG